MEDGGIFILDTGDLQIDPHAARRVNIGSEEVQMLLGLQPGWTDRYKAWNSDLLGMLAGIDRQAREVFKKRVNVLPQLKLRMIAPKTPLSTGILRYDALSYTWHNGTWAKAPELRASNGDSPIDGHVSDASISSPISKDFWKVLLSESASAGHLLWADQICIDQNNEVEKSVSIGFTDRVYQNAERVFLAIEDLSLSESLLPSLQTLTQMKSADRQSLTSLSPTVVQHALEFCVTLFSARLFTRAWCLHEFACSDRHVIFIPVAQENGNSSLRILRMGSQSLSNIVHVTALMIQNASDKQMIAVIPYADSIGRALRIGTKLLKHQTNPSFIEAYRNAFRAKAKHKADQLSITLNSCTSGLLYAGPPLDSKEECYRLLNSVALAAGDASVIGVTGKPLCNTSGSRSTWLMEPSDDEARSDFYAARHEPTQFHVQINDDGGLLIDVIELGVVTDVRNAESRFLDIASAFMDLDFTHIARREPFIFENALHDNVLNEWDKEELRFRFVNQKFFFAQALAYILAQDDTAFFDILESPRSPSSKHFTNSERERLSTVFNWLREYAGPIHALHLSHTKPETVTDSHLSATTNFLVNFIGRDLGMKDMYDTSSRQSWYSYKIGTLSASTLSLPDVPLVVPRACPTAIIVVPADVAGGDYSMLRRVWVLQRADDGSDCSATVTSGKGKSEAVDEYKLLFKTMLVGLQDLAAAPRKRVEIA